MTEDFASLRASDEASKRVQKTPNRVALDTILGQIVQTEFLHPESLPSMTIAVVHLRNGFALVGKSAPADPDNFNRDLGRKFAKEDAVRQAWPLFAFALRETISGSSFESTVPSINQ